MKKFLKRLTAIVMVVIMIFTVAPANIKNVEAASKPKLSKKSTNIVIGQKKTIKVKNVPKGAKVTYKSNNKKIATVTKKGRVKGINSGKTKITVTVKNGKKTIKLNYKVNVKKPSISKGKISLTVGEKTKLSIKNKPKSAKYIWSSNNKNVVMVDKNGNIIAKSKGTATIRVSVKTQKKTYKLYCKVVVQGNVLPDNIDDNVESTYTVTFDSNGGSKVPQQTVPKGKTATKPANPTKEGYDFVGWYNDKVLKTEYDFKTKVVKNITLYAKWNEKEDEKKDEKDDLTDSNDTVVEKDDIYVLSANCREVLAESSTDVVFSVNTTLTTSSFELYCDGVATGVFLYDNGDYSGYSDDIPNDGCYTGIYTIEMSEEKDVEFTAVATIGTTKVVTEPFEIFVYNELTDEELSEMDEIEAEVGNIIASVKNSVEIDSEINMIPEICKAVDEYLYSLVDSDIICNVAYDEENYTYTWIYTRTGIDTMYIIYNIHEDEDIKSAYSTDEISQNRKTTFTKAADIDSDNYSKGSVAILNCYPQGHQWSNRYDTIGEQLSNAGFDVTSIYDFECEDFKNLQEYNSLILLDSHGNTYTGKESGSPMICTEEKQTKEKNKKYSADIKKNRIKKITLEGGDKVYWISSKLFDFYYQDESLSNPIINLGCCRGYPDGKDELVKAIKDAGAAVVNGYNASVGSSYDYNMASSIVTRLLLGDSIDEALTSAKQSNGERDSYKDDDWNKNAVLNYYGESTATLYQELKNGTFDSVWNILNNGVVAWERYGDARSIYKLSGIRPQSQPKMAIISSGFGSMNENTTSAIYQTFLVPEHANTISFTYDVVSEEPMEYVGTSYNDTFTAELLNTSGEVLETLSFESVNSSTWYAVNGINFPGGDDTTYHTRWINVSSDVISKYRGELVVLQFMVKDAGDSNYDTAVLVDSVSIN